MAFGVMFKAEVIVEVEELPDRKTESSIERRIHFRMIEGDFKLFNGIWLMSEVVGEESRGGRYSSIYLFLSF